MSNLQKKPDPDTVIGYALEDSTTYIDHETGEIANYVSVKVTNPGALLAFLVHHAEQQAQDKPDPKSIEPPA